jgi:Kef-type K+ transport system membrane component KefB
MGAIIPDDGKLAREMRTRLLDGVTLLLLPAFFAYVGIRTQINLVTDATHLAPLAAIVLVATVGKFGGTFFAARYMRYSWRESAALSMLMNTRGLMELIVLNIGLDLGIISESLFALMVLFAIITTVATAPVVTWIFPAPSPSPSSPPTQ